MGKQKKPLKTLVATRTVNNLRGSTLWAYNHYRISILTSLLNDLIILENTGINEEYCRRVRESLGFFVNATTEIPSGGFMTGNLLREVAKFEELYREWNGIEGEKDEHIKQRRKLLVELRRTRQRITDKVRDLQYELDNDLDRVILASTYKAIGDLITMVPDLFKNLAQSYSDYLKRGGFVEA